jgi:hypothetical protein
MRLSGWSPPCLRHRGLRDTVDFGSLHLKKKKMTGTQRQSASSSATAWRLALLMLAIGLGLTNIVELAATFRLDYWNRVGLIGLSGQVFNGQLRVAPNFRQTAFLHLSRSSGAGVLAIEEGAMVSVLPMPGADERSGLAPSVLEFARYANRDEPIDLRIDNHGQSTTISATHAEPADASGKLVFYSQVVVDLIFAVVGGLLAWRRPEDKAIRALAIAMICWSSNIPACTAHPVFDILFFINQLTARVWVEILLVYWAIHLSALSRWGISRTLQRCWPFWAAFTIVLGFLLRISMYSRLPLPVDALQKITDVNQTILYLAPLVALTEGIFSTQGETRTRIRWGLFVFGFHFLLFPFRIYIEPILDVYWPDGLRQITLDSCLQLVLPLGLLYATLRHRLLDLNFALNRSLVFGAISAIVLLTFFGLEKLSESVVRPEGREQNVLLAGCIAFGIFLFFHKVRDWVEHNVERFLFSSWHHKETALREYVRSAAHITKVDALISSCLAAVNRFTDDAGCAIYRRSADGDYQCLQSSIAGAPTHMDGNDAVVLAMRVERGVIRCTDVESALKQELAVPILNRGDIDGFMLINRKLNHEAYRPDELAVLEFCVQQIGLDLTALEREQYKQQASELEVLASTARSSADEMRTLLRLALGRHAAEVADPASAAEGSGGRA